jgi:4-azaleucine resistance transporter AzlC
MIDSPKPILGFRDGLLATLPLAPGVIAFGLVYGVTAVQAGFTPLQAYLMSLMVHAGSSQFVAVGMWNTSTGLAIILTTLIINLRHMLMGASIAPYVRHLPTRWKALLAMWMSDESYALSIARYQKGECSHLYFFGANLGIYLYWPLSGLIGALIGTTISDPSKYGLDLIFPLAFIGLLSVFIDGWLPMVVALASGALALGAVELLPGKWYVLVAGIAGSLLGLLLEERRGTWKNS